METSLYGREYELGWLHNRVIRVPGQQNLPNLTLVYGVPGIGKSALLRSFVSRTLNRNKGPTLIFMPEIIAGARGVEVFAESLFHSAAGSADASINAWHQLGDQFSRKIVSLRRNHQNSGGEAYSAKGRVTALNVSEMAVVGDPRGYRLSELCIETLSALFDQLKSKSGFAASDFCVVFCFDQFADYSPSVKKWVGSVLMSALIKAQNIPIPRVLITGRESWDVGGQRDYWEVPLGRLHEYQLTPINRSSCIKWLVDKGIQPDVIDEMMERTEGVPRKIIEMFADQASIEAMEAEVIRSEGSASVSVKQRRWLHAAAILQYVDREGLSVVLGERDGDVAFNWLKGQVSSEGITLVDGGSLPQIFLTSVLRQKVISECARKFPDRHKDFQKKISIQKRLLEKVPSSKHREYLRRLIPIEPFDLEMIDKIYGGDA